MVTDSEKEKTVPTKISDSLVVYVKVFRCSETAGKLSVFLEDAKRKMVGI